MIQTSQLMFEDSYLTTMKGVMIMIRSQLLIEAVVTQVHDGPKPFVSTSLRKSIGDDLPKGTHVTFSLGLWTEEKPPEAGQVVRLGDLRLYSGGWRAFSVQPIIAEVCDDNI